jgi:integrase
MSFLLKSVLAEEMYEYLAVLDGAEKDTESYITVFKSLDSYLAESGVVEKSLPESVVMGWLTGLTMSSRTRNYTIGRVRRFSRYLIAVGVPAFEPDFIRAGSTFIAYTFSDEEFEAIIKAADSGIANAVKSETEHIFPMLFRVLYGCGLRIGDAYVKQKLKSIA